MEQRQLGKIGPMVSRQGLGCMGMSIIYGQPDDAASLSTLHRALDLGVNMIVTSDAYGNGVNETLVGGCLYEVWQLGTCWGRGYRIYWRPPQPCDDFLRSLAQTAWC